MNNREASRERTEEKDEPIKRRAARATIEPEEVGKHQKQ
jgi:hypothetical protein